MKYRVSYLYRGGRSGFIMDSLKAAAKNADSFAQNPRNFADITIESIPEEEAEKSLPEITVGSVWRHRNGVWYVVKCFANEPGDEKYPLTVIYEGPSGKLWARRADDWHRSMKPAGPREWPVPL